MRFKIKLKILDTKTEKGAVIGHKVKDMEEKKEKDKHQVKNNKRGLSHVCMFSSSKSPHAGPNQPSI